MNNAINRVDRAAANDPDAGSLQSSPTAEDWETFKILARLYGIALTKGSVALDEVALMKIFLDAGID